MGPTPAKVGRIIARDTQTTWPDPWSNGSAKPESATQNRISGLKISGGVTLDLGSVVKKGTPG